MAGDNDGDWIVVIRHPDCAESARTTNGACLVGVGARFAIWDGKQRIPAPQLKLTAKQVQRLSKNTQLAREVSVQFALPAIKASVRALPCIPILKGGETCAIKIKLQSA